MSRFFRFFHILPVALLSLLCGCGRNNVQPLKPAEKAAAPAPDYVVAIVNNTPLTWENMERRAMGFLKDDVETNHLVIPESRMDEAKDHFRKRAIQAFAYKTIMMAEATKNKIQVTDKDRNRGMQDLAVSLKQRNWTTNDFFNNGPMPAPVMHKEFEDGLIIEKFIKSQILDKIELKEGEVETFTKQLQDSNDKKRQQLEDIRKQILAGADFAEMATKHSECKSSKNKGGDLGEFARGKMVKEFENAAFSQKVGEVGPVITSPYGFHIIKVTAHSPKKEATDSTPEIPETVRASHILIKTIPIIKKKVIETLQRERYQQESKKLYRSLLANADVKCFLFENMEF